VFYWISAIAWMAVIFHLSGRTGSELQSIFPFISDFNPGHILAYFILALLIYPALRKNNRSHPYLKTFLLCLTYGLTDEFHQYFVPTRHPDIFDLTRDTLGAGSALVLLYWLQTYRQRKTKPNQSP